MIFVVVVMALCFERCARDFVDYIKNRLYGILFLKTKVKIELPDDDGPQPMDVDEAAELRRTANHRKRLYEEASEELADKKREAQSWEQCASDYAARNRCMQEELVSEHPSPTTTGSEREEPRCSLADRDEWELKSDHYKKKADTYAAQIEDLETTLRGYKRANDSANDAANYYKDQVDHHLADLNSQVETNHRQSEADKAEIEELKTEIEKLKAENMALKQAQSEKPSGSKGNKTPGIFDNHPKRPSSTPPEKLMAIIDKQSFEMVEMKKKLAAAEEHVASLRREMQQVRTPETVVATKAGQCFHAHGCNHLLHGREQRAYVELRKCKDGLPWPPVAQSERQPEWVFHGQGWHAQIWEV